MENILFVVTPLFILLKVFDISDFVRMFENNVKTIGKIIYANVNNLTEVDLSSFMMKSSLVAKVTNIFIFLFFNYDFNCCYI